METLSKFERAPGKEHDCGKTLGLIAASAKKNDKKNGEIQGQKYCDSKDNELPVVEKIESNFGSVFGAVEYTDYSNVGVRSGVALEAGAALECVFEMAYSLDLHSFQPYFLDEFVGSGED